MNFSEQSLLLYLEYTLFVVFIFDFKIVIAFNFTSTRKISDDTDEIDIDAIIKAITKNC